MLGETPLLANTLYLAQHSWQPVGLVTRRMDRGQLQALPAAGEVAIRILKVLRSSSTTLSLSYHSFPLFLPYPPFDFVCLETGSYYATQSGLKPVKDGSNMKQIRIY